MFGEHMEDQPIHASQISAEQSTAEHDLKVALSYIEDAERPFFDKNAKLTYDHTPDLFDKLNKAAQYVAAARAKNLTQTLTVQNENEPPIKYTQDDISGAISYREGRVALIAWETAYDDRNKKKALIRAREAFAKATQFCPSRPSYFLNLAEVYRLQVDKKAAIEAVQIALQLDPKSIDAVKLKDEIARIPDILPPRPKRKAGPFTYGCFGFLAGAACWAIGISLNWNTPATEVGAAFPGILLMLVGMVLFFGVPILGVMMALKDPREDPLSYEHYRSRRLARDTTQFLHDEYEKRYQAEMERKFQ